MADSVQIGFVGLGRMGGNMVAPHPSRLGAQRRRLRSRRRGGRARARAWAPRAPRRSRNSSTSSTRRGWSGSWSRPATPTQETVDKLANLLEPGDTIIDGGNSRWTDDKARAPSSSRRASTTSTSELPAASGASRSATA